MYTLKELEEFSNGKIINGDHNTEITFFSTSRKKHIKGEFYIPFIFKNINREVFIIDSVLAGGKGFIINKNSKNYDTIISKAMEINHNICIWLIKDFFKNNLICYYFYKKILTFLSFASKI